LDASPAVMKDNSVPPDRRSRCRVGGRTSGVLSSMVRMMHNHTVVHHCINHAHQV
jgi:hypothetical protein